MASSLMVATDSLLHGARHAIRVACLFDLG
jgi:hypothetical protein